MPGPYHLKAVTLNNANNSFNGYYLRQEIQTENPKPDIIVVGYQEANDVASSLSMPGYTLISDESYTTMTKPFKLAEVGQCILVKDEHIDEIFVRKESIKKEHWIHGYNKGGVRVELELLKQDGSSKTIGIASGHFDTENPQYRKDEFDALVEGFSACDGEIILADYNERLITYNANGQTILEVIEAYQQEKQLEDVTHQTLLESRDNTGTLIHAELHRILIKDFCPLLSNEDQRYDGYTFRETEILTYVKFDNEGNIKASNDSNHPYKIGAFDNIAYKDNSEDKHLISPEGSAKVYRNYDSDHSYVSTTYTVTTDTVQPEFESESQTLLNKLKAKIQSKSFDLGFGGSRYSVNINDKKYEVPHRIYKIYNILNSQEEWSRKKQGIKTITSDKFHASNFLFGRTQSSTDQYIKALDRKI
ncbi:hypothetical protein L3V82_11315 [Thiotrichales bacterium 19S3-7]|nr:hypothetical protein [Thiotrichales bacterium 19S3-7]MCF6802769.1 hypothetical protein [Thiotrichales bacterium 19S3-11]